MAQEHAKDAPLAQSPANVARIKNGAQCAHRILGKGAREAHDDFRLRCRAQGSRRSKEVEHVRT